MNIISKHQAEIERKSPYDIRCTVNYSAPMEELFCINAMLDPGDHKPIRNWLRKRQDLITPQLYSELLYYKNHYCPYFVGDLVEYLSVDLPPEECNITNIIRLIKEMDPINFSYIVLGFAAFRIDRKQIERFIAQPDTITEEDLAAQKKYYTAESISFFFKNISLMQQKIAWMIDSYWEQAFKFDWKMLEPVLHQAAERERMKIEELGTVNYINSLSDRILLKEGQIFFIKSPDFSIPVKALSRISISFSAFISDSDFGANIIDDTLYLTKPLSLSREVLEMPFSETLISLFQVMGDEIRFKIMRILNNGEETTQNLSVLLQVTPSVISFHLKQLKSVGLVQTRKEGKFVYYRLDTAPLKELETILMKNIHTI